jgi:hypothetical protein
MTIDEDPGKEEILAVSAAIDEIEDVHTDTESSPPAPLPFISIRLLRLPPPPKRWRPYSRT